MSSIAIASLNADMPRDAEDIAYFDTQQEDAERLRRINARIDRKLP